MLTIFFMRIRRFRPEDAKIVSNIIKQNFLKVNSEHYSQETIAVLIKESTSKKLIEKSKTRHLYVAIDKDVILGVAGYEEDELHTFFVRKNIHGRGVGKKLMERVLKDAKNEGIKVMNSASTHYAEKFYASFGFKKIEEKTVEYHGAPLSFVLMKKKL